MSEALTVALTGSCEQAALGPDDPRLMIGVGSVIVLIAVGTGSSSAVQSQIDALGSNTLTVTAAPTVGRPVRRAARAQGYGGRCGRAEQPLRGRPMCRASRRCASTSATLTYGSSTYSPSTFVGTTPSYAQARDYSIGEGRWFTKAEVKDHSHVLVVGPTVVTELFGGADPVGDTVQISGTDFQVIGVTASQGLERLDRPRRRRDGAADGGTGRADRLREHRPDPRAGRVT